MKNTAIPAATEILPGRQVSMEVSDRHFVNGNPVKPPFPETHEQAMFGMGCFWGAEKIFWLLPGIYSTAVGYAGGGTPNANYEEVCSGKTGHSEVVGIVFDPDKISYEKLLKLFWESHNPTQGMRQGNDTGTQYRSVIYTYNSMQHATAVASRSIYEMELVNAGFPPTTTEILPSPEFYYAEDYHQQYLAKNPAGYCGLMGTGVKYPE
jgi:peptide-methionine (S)-S-oxide reductase